VKEQGVCVQSIFTVSPGPPAQWNMRPIAPSLPAFQPSLFPTFYSSNLPNLPAFQHSKDKTFETCQATINVSEILQLIENEAPRRKRAGYQRG